MTDRRLVAAALALAVVGVLAVLVLDDGAESAPTVLVAVCDVARAARQGDQRAAADLFVDQAHEPLHALASSTADGGDRGAAARLLEAKNAVESAEPGPTPAAAEELVSATQVALAATAGSSPPACS